MKAKNGLIIEFHSDCKFLGNRKQANSHQAESSDANKNIR